MTDRTITRTYRAMQVTARGTLELVERETPAPGPDEVLVAVEACGICGADRGDIENAHPAARRMPGHEVVGRIVGLGPHVTAIWTVGQQVGVGRFGGPCLECPAWRSKRLQLCHNQLVLGSTCDGGYAEMLLARATGLVSIPQVLSSEETAPILCAGITTFNGLKASSAESGDTVAVLGVGGLCHMALQYARRMGFRVVAIRRGKDIAADAADLGAHRYIDTDRENAAEVLEGLGGAAAILTTISNAEVISALMPALAPREGSCFSGSERTHLRSRWVRSSAASAA